MNSSNLNQPQFCACANLRMASRAVTQFYDEALKSAGLRGTQFSLLVMLSKTGDIAISELASRLVMDRTTLTRNLKPLEKQGMIAVGQGEDRRTRLVTLAAPGRAALARAMPLWEQAQAQVTKALGEERFRHLLTDLSEIIDSTNIEARNKR